MNVRYCDYYRGRGFCSFFNCYSEPACQTCEPIGGWPRRTDNRRQAFLAKAYLRIRAGAMV